MNLLRKQDAPTHEIPRSTILYRVGVILGFSYLNKKVSVARQG